jgi:predicted molibdopterin-dependent oxidoreductase YjgC
VDGTFTNLEGRVSRVVRKVTSPGTSRPDWMIAVDLADRLGTDLGFMSSEDVWAELTAVSAVHADLSSEAIAAESTEGVLVMGGLALVRPEPTLVPARQPSALRLVATRSMYDTGVLVAHSPSLSGLAPGARAALEPAEMQRLGIVDGEVVDLVGPKGTVQVPVVADAGVAAGTVHLLVNQPGVDVAALLDAGAPVTDVKLVRR